MNDTSSLPNLMQSALRMPKDTREPRVIQALENAVQALRFAAAIGLDIIPETERDEVIEAAEAAELLARGLALPVEGAEQ